MREYAAREKKPLTVSEPAYHETFEPDFAAPMSNAMLLEQIEGLQSRPEPLSDTALGSFGERFNADFSGLRLYKDEGLSDLGQAAYARGNEIHFDSNIPVGSGAGPSLMSHELGHIVQQGSGLAQGGGILRDPALESMADTGFAAPSNFVMPASSQGAPVQGAPSQGKMLRGTVLEKAAYLTHTIRQSEDYVPVPEHLLAQPNTKLKKESLADDDMRRTLVMTGTLSSIAMSVGNSITDMVTDEKDIGNAVKGGFSGGNAVANAYQVVGNWENAKKHEEQGAKAQAFFDKLDSYTAIAGTMEGAAEAIGYLASNDTILKQIVPGLSAVSGAITALKGLAEADFARVKRKNINWLLQGIRGPDDNRRQDLTAEEEEDVQILKQLRARAKIQMMEGSFNIATGALDTIAGVLTVVGGAPAAAVLSIVSVVGKTVKTGLSMLTTKYLQKNVLERRLKLTSNTKKILKLTDMEFSDYIRFEKRINRMLLMNAGFEHGSAQAAFDQITINRAQKMVKAANSGDEKYILYMKGIGLKPNKDGEYSVQALVEEMGMDRDVPWQEQFEKSQKKGFEKLGKTTQAAWRTGWQIFTKARAAKRRIEAINQEKADAFDRHQRMREDPEVAMYLQYIEQCERELERATEDEKLVHEVHKKYYIESLEKLLEEKGYL
jgi:hypothetical protein